jgi:DEAD/DEAH box helicase domain-containing protein
MLKIGITLIEDIEPGELSASVQKEGEWSIYIADTLDNGSGYSAKYASATEYRKLVQYLTDVFAAKYLLTEAHTEACISSCYKCLRNYENRFAHSGLDWRLALDLLHVYIGEYSDEIPFAKHWDSVFSRCELVLRNVMQEDIVRVNRTNEVVYSFSKKGRKVGLLFWHPLLPGGASSINACRKVEEEELLDEVHPINPYFLIRDPIGEVTLASSPEHKAR